MSSNYFSSSFGTIDSRSNVCKTSCINDTISNAVLEVNSVATCIIAFLCIIGNGSFIILFVCNKSIRNLNTHAVLCLAIGDVLRGTIVMIPKMVTELGHYCDVKPHVFGYVTAFVSAFTFVFNPMILALIAFIRYVMIVPWTRRAQWMTFTKLHVIIALIFSAAVLFSCLPFMSARIGTYEFSIYHGVYFTSWGRKNVVFRSIFYACVIGVAFPVLILSYVKIWIELHRHYLKMKVVVPGGVSRSAGTVDQPNGNDGGKSSSEKVLKTKTKKLHTYLLCCKGGSKTEPYTVLGDEKQQQQQQQQRVKMRISKQEYQTTKMMSMICVAYIICWFPAAVVTIIALSTNHCNMPGIWKMAIVTIIEVKTCLNPFFYGLGNKQYREMVIDYFKKRFKIS